MSPNRYRTKLGTPIDTCMACANELITKRELELGLCEMHQRHIIKPPLEIERDFGRGKEIQLLQHSDDLDDIIYKLDYDIEPERYRLTKDPELKLNLRHQPNYLIYAHYLGRIFQEVLLARVDLGSFDYITFADSSFVRMEYVFLEIGYLSQEYSWAETLLMDDLHVELQEEGAFHVAGKRILLLDLYRTFETKYSIDCLKAGGAKEIVTVYLTSYS